MEEFRIFSEEKHCWATSEACHTVADFWPRPWQRNPPCGPPCIARCILNCAESNPAELCGAVTRVRPFLCSTSHFSVREVNGDIDWTGQSAQFESFLRHLRAACLAQQRADAGGLVPCSRHLLACLCRITGAELLIGVLSVSHNPHFQHAGLLQLLIR